MNKKMIIFPGQGSQYIGMGKDFYENFQISKEIFEKVDNEINFKISDLIFNGDINELTKTENNQVALMTVSIAILEALKLEGKINLNNISYLAGHSLGEYTALCAANVFSLEQTVKLLRKRGILMSQSSAIQSGMAAVLGSDPNIIQEKIDQIKDKEILTIANDNCPGQIVISGNSSTIDRFIELNKTENFAKIIKLPVSSAFHSPLMQSASEAMQQILQNTEFNIAKIQIIQNFSGKIETFPEKIKKNLQNQMTNPVLWNQSMKCAIDNGVTTFIEIGAKNVLTNMLKRTSKEISTINIEKITDIQNISAEIYQ